MKDCDDQMEQRSSKLNEVSFAGLMLNFMTLE